VDSSAAPVGAVVDEFAAHLQLRYMRHLPPSASAQRNAGVAAVTPECELIGFLDDDAALEPIALSKMLEYWETASPHLGGCAFNMVNHPAQKLSMLKRSVVTNALGVYRDAAGGVAQSGWNTMIGTVSQDLEVDWLPSGAAVWRAEVLRTHRFDEYFTGYSYLEDLDFSYSVSRRWRLAVVADARYYHFPSRVRHARQYAFGKKEVYNRLYVVRKHGLSVPRCWLGLTLRLALTLCTGVARLNSDEIKRALGNCSAIAAELVRISKRRAAGFASE
jgi:GT2 family glycosyltransferase